MQFLVMLMFLGYFNGYEFKVAISFEKIWIQAEAICCLINVLQPQLLKKTGITKLSRQR